MGFYIRGGSGLIGLIVIILFVVAASIWMGGSSPQPSKPTDERCFQKGVAGPCEGLIYGYQYDQNDGLCKKFLWGGCEGVRPFKTMEECQSVCEIK